MAVGQDELSFLESISGDQDQDFDVKKLLARTAQLYAGLSGFPVDCGRPHTDNGLYGFVRYNPNQYLLTLYPC